MTDTQGSEYRRIAAALEQRITSGDLAPGDRLPPIPELARAEGVSEAPVRMALTLLRDKGLLESRGRAGTRVTTPPPAIRMPADRYQRTVDDAWTSAAASTRRVDDRLEHLHAKGELADQFDARPGTCLLARHQVLYTNDVPYQLLISYLRWADVARTHLADQAAPAPGSGSVRAQLESIGIHPIEIRERFTCRPATPNEADTLNLRPGTVVSRCTRRHLTASGDIVEVGRLIHRADTLTIDTAITLTD